MRTISLFILALMVLGCAQAPGHNSTLIPPKNANLKSIEGLGRYALGSPVQYRNVTVVPVMLTSSDKIQTEDYISLTEAKKNGWVEINEMPNGQEVSRLYVRNLGKKPLLLLSGELLLGGKQDRVVAKDTVVPPGEEMPVPVFCVEHGRWDGETSKFEYSESMAPQSVRKRATFGSQQDVWDQVSEYNKSANASGRTTSVRDGLYGKEIQTQIDDGLRTLTDALAREENVVGFVCLVDGHIQTFELFGNASMFSSSRDALLRGFLAEAALHPDAESKPADLDEIGAFIKRSLSGERQQSGLARGNGNWSVSSGGVQGAEATLPAASTPLPNEAPKAETFLHGSYTPK